MEWRGDDIDEESVVESTDESGDAEGPELFERRVKKLRDEISALRKEKQEYMDGWQRAKADYVNALKRFEEEKKQEKGRGVVKAVEALMPAFDALARAREGGEMPPGFDGIAKQIESAFYGLGLTAVGQKGELFNPALHEALGQDPTDVCKVDDTVSAVLEKGWKIGDSLIRPAKVRVYHVS